MSHLSYSIDDRVATLTLDNPPQNRIDEQVADELAEAVDAVGRSDATSSRGRTWARGSYARCSNATCPRSTA
jgi:enoyl-CoA hydratase/carnithine racemase